MAKHRKTGGIYGKTCRGKQRNTRGYMRKQENRGKKAGREKMAKP